MDLKNEITARLCAEAFIEEASGLADTEVEKLAKLSEGIEFADVNQYRQKVALLKESYFGQNSDAVIDNQQYVQSYGSQMLTEGTTFVGGTTQEDSLVENIANTISVIAKSKPARPAFKPLNDNPMNSRIQEIMNPQISQDNLF